MYNLPDNLKKLRRLRGLTQTQIAATLNMTYQEYQKIESGKTVIRADKLYHICDTLNISSDELLGIQNAGITPPDNNTIPGKNVDTRGGKKVPVAAEVVKTGFKK